MNIFWQIIRKEGVLLIRQKLLALPLVANLIIWSYIIIVYELQSLPFEEKAAVFYKAWVWVLLLNLFIFGMIAIYMSQRDRDMKFEQLALTYSVTNTKWLLAKQLLIQLYAFLIVALTIVIQMIWFSTASMPLTERLQHAVYVFVQMEVALFFIITVGFFFGTVIKHIVAYLSIPLFLLLMFLFPIDNVGTALWFDNPYTHLLTAFDFMFIQTPYETIWGIDRVFLPTLVHQGSGLFLGFVILFLTLLSFYPQRLTKKEKRVATICMSLAFIPFIFLGTIRFQQYDEALKTFIATGKQYMSTYTKESGLEYYEWWNSFYDTSLDDEPYDMSIESMNLSLSLLAPNEIKATSELIVKNEGTLPVEDIYFTLYHGLKVKNCEGHKVNNCDRDRDYLLVQLSESLEPAEEVTLNIQYAGNILQYRYDAYVEQAFIDTNRVYLPKEAGWYPLIGKRPLVVAREDRERFVNFDLRNGYLVEDFPTEYTVTIHQSFKELPLYLTIPKVGTHTFQGSSLYGLSLVGGNAAETTVGEVRVVGHPEILPAALKIVKEYQVAWDFIEEWLGISMTPNVIYILHEEQAHLSHNTNQGVVFWNGSMLKDITHEEMAIEITNELIRKKMNFVVSRQDYSVFSEVFEWTVLNQLESVGSFYDWYKQQWGELIDDLTLVERLHEYETLGEDRWLDVMKFLFHYSNSIEDIGNFDLEQAIKTYEEERFQ